MGEIIAAQRIRRCESAWGLDADPRRQPIDLMHQVSQLGVIAEHLKDWLRFDCDGLLNAYLRYVRQCTGIQRGSSLPPSKSTLPAVTIRGTK
jgi:hypothetical protein